LLAEFCGRGWFFRDFGGRRWGWGGVSVFGTRTLVRFFVFGRDGEGIEGAVVGALEAGLVAIEGGEGAGFVAQEAKGEGGAGLVVADIELHFDLWQLAGHLDVEESGFHIDGAGQAPAGGDELVDQEEVAGGLGLELGEVGVAKGAELVLGFGFEDDGVGGEAVDDGGVLAAGESLGGDRSVRKGAIGA
jgi:hypothetical protein